jgi:hypothetical protein
MPKALSSPRSPSSSPRLLVERPLPQDGTPRIESVRPGAPIRKGRLARSVTVNLAESPLSWLRARGHGTARQYDAGETLRRDYELSHLAARVTMQCDAPPAGKTARGAPEGLNPGEGQIAAKRRFEAAAAALGPALEDIAWRVLCAGEGLKAAEGGLGWPARSGKLVLGLALDRLAEHYRLPG